MKNRNYINHLIRTLQASLIALLFVIGSCYPGGPEYIDELDLVYTNYNPDFNFTDQNTYSLPNQVIEINDDNFSGFNGTDLPEFIDPVYSEVMLARIKENMSSLGWTEVDKGENPDVILLVSVSTDTNLLYYYDWGYWGWWYPGYYPGWNWWYPGYYPPTISSYRTGSVLIQMTNPKGVGANDNVPVVWTSVINGLLEGSTASINDRLRQTIDQAFTQSPYL